MFLPDVNLWLALAFEVHVHHPAARAWFEGEPGGTFQDVPLGIPRLNSRCQER